MTREVDPWRLPSAAAWLDEIEEELDLGLLIVPADGAMPPSFDAALRGRLSARHWSVDRVQPDSTETPATSLAEPLGVASSLDGLLTSSLYEHALIVDLSQIDPDACNAWQIFLQRFYAKRRSLPGRLAILLQGVTSDWADASNLPALAWADRLRRLDVTIWADLHAPTERPEPLATLATSLAVELCAWRLDLAAAIVQARTEDLIDPLAWLSRRDELALSGQRRFGSGPLECPLHLLAKSRHNDLERRIWRAQLSAFFPWLEEQRLDMIRRHRPKLRLDEHLRRLGVRDADDIELGALAWQLEGSVSPNELAFAQCLARIRNSLAHRVPAIPHDLREALRCAGSMASTRPP